MVFLLVPILVVACWLVAPGARARMAARFTAASPPSVTLTAVCGVVGAALAQTAPRENVAAWVVFTAGELLVIVWALYVSRQVDGLVLVAMGTAVNLLVVVANRGMPVPLGHPAPAQFLHHVTTSADRLLWLSDRFHVGSGVFGGWDSIGDVIVLVGMGVVVAQLAWRDRQRVPASS